MIHSVQSNIPTFKNIEFYPNFNILLCDLTEESTSRQTRNRAGKTSLVEIIHFILGSKADVKSLFRRNSLSNANFQMKFDLSGQELMVSRSGQDPNTIYLLDGDFRSWTVKPQLRVLGSSTKSTKKPKKSTTPKNNLETSENDDLPGVNSLTLTEWNRVLGELMFNLQATEESNKGRYTPTYRSLVSYFARRVNGGGMLQPQTQSSDQQLYDEQAALLYLLGLDWQLSSEWKEIREKESSLKELKKIAKSGVLGSVILKSSDLQTKVVRAENEVNQLRIATEQFKVLEGYRQFEAEASSLTRKINQKLDENSLDEQLIHEHEIALQDEMAPSIKNLESLYDEVGIVFPNHVNQRLDAAREFHISVIANRKSYLETEINEARRRISGRNSEIQIAETRREELYSLLKEHGAMEQMVGLHAELGRAESRLSSLNERYKAAQKLESQSSELSLDRKTLEVRLRRHFDEREETVKRIIRLFEEVSQSLHEEDAGSLTITAGSNGPKIEFQILGSRSEGIKSMQIFCFDLVLARLCAENGTGPGFLIHDSHLFDGVDTRQVRFAFEKAAQWSKEYNFQYIVTMNSDVMPTEFSDNFNVEDYVLPVHLTDDETGGLFGFRFED